ncbi:hypothetical protein [Hymenobacter antarcticus]|uniref:Outer membrane protein beta-barrel domain-containing protein n=1 Tax=Hymenobacter antarcticus TaxID=486270 RepID=A0ABP7PKA0_9BACT
MLKRILLLLTASLFYTFQTQAQAYEPGLLVRTNGDTLRGEIENGFWTEPPAFIRYRSTPDRPSQLFQPRQLRAVSFTGGRYFRYEALPIDYAAETRLDRLPGRSFTNVLIDSLLADVLVEGPVTLFRVGGSATTHYLLSSPGRPVLDMSARRYFSRTGNGTDVVVDGNNYLNQLALYFGDCPAAYQAARKATFTPAALAEVVQAYNQSCAPAQSPGRSWVAQTKPRRVVAFQGGVVGGVRYNRTEAESEPQSGACADCRPHPFAGLYGELLLSSRALALYGELSVSTFRGKSYQGYYLSPQQLDPLYHHFTYQALLGTARLGVRYYLPLAHEQQLILGFGYELNTVRNPTLKTAPGPAGAPDLQYLEFHSPTLLPNVAVGWRAQRLTLFTDIQLYNSFLDDSYSTQFITSNLALRLGMSYRLGGNPDVAGKGPPTAR